MSSNNNDIQKYKEQLNKYYSEKSSVYESSYTGKGRYRSNLYRLLIVLKLLNEINPHPDLILEAGCGDARVVAEVIKEGFHCLGFDINKDMLEEGKKILAKNGIDTELIKEGGIYNIPYEDNTFDAILCLGVLGNIPEHKKVFQEFKRVLKSKGRVIISLNNELFSLFSMNEYTLKFYKEIFKDINIDRSIQKHFMRSLEKWLNLESIISLDKVMQDSEINKASVTIEKYNPLNIHEIFKKIGYDVEKVRFYHYHPLPPRFEKEYPELFMSFAETLETTAYDWKGAILCNAMVIQLKSIN